MNNITNRQHYHSVLMIVDDGTGVNSDIILRIIFCQFYGLVTSIFMD